MQALGLPRTPRDDRGAAALEMALILPVLVAMIGGIVNFGFLFAQQISLNNGARQAARYAVVDGRDCSQIQAEGRLGAETIGMTATEVPTPVIMKGSVTACPSSTARPCAGAPAGTNITVTMSRTPSQWSIPFPPFHPGTGGIPVPTIKSKGVMRCEFQ